MSKVWECWNSFPPELCQSFSISWILSLSLIYFSSRIFLHQSLIIMLTGLATISMGNLSKSTIILTCNCRVFWTCKGNVGALNQYFSVGAKRGESGPRIYLFCGVSSDSRVNWNSALGLGMHIGNDLVTPCLANLGNVKAIWTWRRSSSYFTAWDQSHQVFVALTPGGKILPSWLTFWWHCTFWEAEWWKLLGTNPAVLEKMKRWFLCEVFL